MEKANIGNWLLTVGTVLGALGAANSHKSGKWVELESGQAVAGEYLLHPLLAEEREVRIGPSESFSPGVVAWLEELAGEEVNVLDAEGNESTEKIDWKKIEEGMERLEGKRSAEEHVAMVRDVIVPAGAELSAETVNTLIEHGKEKVFARVPAQPVDVVSGAEALTGRTLFEDVVLSKEARELPAGYELGFVDLRELRESGVKELLVEGEEEPQPIGKAGSYALRGKKLTESFSFELPDKLAAGSFVTEELAQEILGAGIGEVKVKVNKKFSFEDWDARLLFFVGVLCMVGGIALKRSVSSGEDGEEGGAESIHQVRRRLEEVTRATAALAERVDSLDAATIHAEVDPIILEGCLPIVEGRNAIIGALGMGGFANVMSSFSSGERRLNRAWSAAVDDYVDEARAAVKDAVPHLESALAALG